MKKHIFPFIVLSVLAGMCCNTSCRKDRLAKKDGPAYDASLLTGEWVLTSCIYTDENRYEEIRYDVSDPREAIVFHADGTCNHFRIATYDQCNWKKQGDWRLDNDQLSLIYYAKEQRTVRLSRLTPSLLSFEEEGSVPGGATCKFAKSYQKVSSLGGLLDTDNPEKATIACVPPGTIKSNISSVYQNRILVNFMYYTSLLPTDRLPGDDSYTTLSAVLPDRPPLSLANRYTSTDTAEYLLKGLPGTACFLRTYVQIGPDVIYSNEMKIQRVEGNIKLSVCYSQEKDQIDILYDIHKKGKWGRCFATSLANSDKRAVGKCVDFWTKDEGRPFISEAYYCRVKKGVDSHTLFSRISAKACKIILSTQSFCLNLICFFLHPIYVRDKDTGKMPV